MAKRKVKIKRSPAEVDYREMIDQDRMEDSRPMPKKVTANTDDEGNPIATKENIYMAKTKSAQTLADQRAYEQEFALPKRIEESENAGRSPQSENKKKKMLVKLMKDKKATSEPNDATFAAVAQAEAMAGRLDDAENTMKYDIPKKRKVKVKSKDK